MCRKKYTGDTITFNIFMLGEALKDLTPVTKLSTSIARSNSFVHHTVQPISLP
jgi:hypothetical protein